MLAHGFFTLLLCLKLLYLYGVPKSYKDLGVYQGSFDLFIRIHEFSMKLLKYETYEQRNQIRRSADSVNSNIVEG